MSDTTAWPDDPISPPKPPPPWSWLDFFRLPLRRVQAESRAFLDSEAGRRVDYKVMIVLLTVALALTAQHFLGMEGGITPITDILRALGYDQLADDFWHLMWTAPTGQLNRLQWWSAVSLLSYVVVPMLLVRLVFRERLRDYGLKLGSVFADFWVYAVMMAVAWPAIYWASDRPRFLETYPFYRLRPGEGAWPNLVYWEVLYTSQFFAVEFLFRGFLVHGLKHRFGAYAIFVMMVPYCMLHFTKPLPETLASILGAVALGFMSLRTRSIWMGTAIHVTVAWSMDAASLWRQGFFG
jgi:membrane protease YdiL (CAAX protease family)